MTEPQPIYGPLHASAYDLLHEGKDYEGEVGQLLGIFSEAPRHVNSLLDLGCGTGRHALLLADAGIEVVGVDASSGMVAVARRRSVGRQGSDRISFVEGDLRQLVLPRPFDAVLMMFSVLGYQLTNEHVDASLQTARRHLVPGGILVLDVLWGPRLVLSGARSSVVTIPTPQGELLRAVRSSLDLRRQLLTLDFRLWALSDGQVIERCIEQHEIRFFFPLELELLLKREGFETGALVPLSGEEEDPPWNMLVWAIAPGP